MVKFRNSKLTTFIKLDLLYQNVLEQCTLTRQVPYILSGSELVYLTHLSVSVCCQPQPRLLHTAVSTDEYMLVFGGRSITPTTHDSLIAYSYACNQWIRLLSKGLLIEIVKCETSILQR